MSEPTNLDATMVCFGGPPAPRTPAPGTRHRPSIIGNYQITRELGRGGMGVVYEGFDARLKRPVAIKMILRDDAELEARTRFQTEAEAVAQLHHPNIVQVFEVGRDADKPFVAFELLPGGSLQTRTQGKPQPPRAAADIVKALAEAMAHAHAAGVVHRDLKPANILFDVNGRPKVTDFGAARVNFGPASSEAGSSLTRVGEIIGTPQYMAPEQARGGPDAAAPAVDVYALGAILYSQLTGRPPFDAPDPFDVLTAVVHTDPVPPRSLQPSVPRDLDTICLKALAKHPSKRYRSAAELAEDLGRFLNGETVRAKPASTAEKVWKRAQRHPVEFGLAAALVIVSFAGLGGVVGQWREALDSKAQADANALAARTAETNERGAKEQVVANLAAVSTAKAAADTARERAETLLSRSRVATAALEWEKGQVERARTILDAVRPDDRQWEWHHLRRTFDASLWSVDGPVALGVSEWLYRVAVSPNGKRVALAGMDPYVPGPQQRTSLYVLDAGSGRVLSARSRTHIGEMLELHWIDDRHIAAASDSGDFYIWDSDRASDAGAIWPRDYPWKEGVNHAFVADGKWAIRSGPRGEMVSYDLVNRRPGPTFAPISRPLRICSVCGTRGLAVVGDTTQENGSLWVCDLATGRVVSEIPGGGYDGAVSPDGVSIVSAGRMPDGRLYIASADVATGRRNWHRWSGGQSFRTITHSPDGRYAIERVTDRNELRIWDAATGGGGRSIRGGNGRFERIAVSPDGQLVAAVGIDSAVRVWRLEDGELFRHYSGHRHNLKDVAFDPTGRVLFSVGTDSRAVAWDLTADRPGARVGVPMYKDYDTAASAGALTFTPDGRIRYFSTFRGFIDLDPQSGQRIAQTPIPEGYGRNVKELCDWAFDAAGTIAVGPDHPNRASFLPGNRLAVFAAGTGKAVRELEPAPLPVIAVAVSPDGSRAAACCITGLGVSGKQYVCVWDLSSGKIVERVELSNRSYAITFHPGGTKVAYSMIQSKAKGGGKLVEYDLSTHTAADFAQAAPEVYTHLRYDDAGAKLAGAVPGGPVVVFDSASRKELWRAEAQGMLTGLAFSPDGERLAGTGYTDVVTLWDTASGAEVYTLVGAKGRLDDLAFPARVAFSKCGKHLAAHHWDASISIWSLDDWDVPADRGAANRRAAAGASTYDFHYQLYRQARHDRNPFARRFHEATLRRLTPPNEMALQDYYYESLYDLGP